ncbi:class I SAM-dependent methyltransferase [Mycobacterium hubeiense]|uniref:class I SAM-dependent methyltransferase n=1 Tax=Mycobacterium hubeiense TaxID=1867256 RepID=UPI000C7ECD5B|nr:class I SAM-dependent methyltransferase [Mycobacterium sp. QGD 101]
MTAPDIAVNHHADHPGFAGVTGTFFGLVMLIAGRRKARLAVDVAAVSEADHVVDIGCGPGTAAREAARRGARVTGVDPSPAMLRVARAFTRKKDSITWLEGTAESLPLPDGTATVVWSLATVHHWQDVDKGVAEIRRVLAPGGRMLAIERVSRPGATGLASHGWTEAQAKAFAALCRNAGLADVRVSTHGSGRRAVWTVAGLRQ